MVSICLARDGWSYHDWCTFESENRSPSFTNKVTGLENLKWGKFKPHFHHCCGGSQQQQQQQQPSIASPSPSQEDTRHVVFIGLSTRETFINDQQWITHRESRSRLREADRIVTVIKMLHDGTWIYNKNMFGVEIVERAVVGMRSWRSQIRSFNYNNNNNNNLIMNGLSICSGL